MFRLYQDHDESKINELFQEVFGKERTTEEWHWKFKENPSGENIISIYEDEQKIRGHVSAIPMKVKCKQEELLFGMRADAMVSPKCRGKGVYKKIVADVIEASIDRNVSFLYGFPAPKAKELFEKYTGAKLLCYVPRLIFIMNPIKLALTRLPSVISKLPGVVPVAKSLRRKPKVALDPRIHEVTKVDASFDQLWEKSKTSYSILIKRDAAYLNWRYFKHPTKKYRMFAYRENDILKGYFVIHEQKRVINGIEFELAYLVDILAINEEKVWESLIHACLQQLSNSDMISTWALDHTALYTYLRSNGFIHKDSPMPFVGVSLKEDTEIGYNVEEWYVTPGDVDSF